MSEEQNIHWSDDAELLERYVLGRMSDEQRAGLDLHLQQCTRCRDAVHSEQVLVAGVRRAGREGLKRRLTERLKARTPARVNWYRVAGVAAAIVLLVTIGINNNWFFRSTPSSIEDGKGSENLATGPQSSPAAQSKAGGSLAEKRRPESEHAAVEKKAPAPVDEAGAVERQEVRAKDKEKLGASGGDQKTEREFNIEGRMSAPAAASQETWVQGALIPERMEVQSAGKASRMDAAGLKDALQKNEPDNRFRPAQAAGSQASVARPQNVTVTQRLISELPGRQQQVERSSSSIQTLVRMDAGGARVVLYLDSLMKQSDIDQAYLQPVSDDSVILNVGRQKIGYRLPAGLNQQLLKPALKTK